MSKWWIILMSSVSIFFTGKIPSHTQCANNQCPWSLNEHCPSMATLCLPVMQEIIDSNNFNNCYYCSFKIFCCFLLAPIHWLILHNQPALTNFGRWEQYTIDAMIYVFRNEVDRWYIWLETRLHGKKTIDQPRFQAGPASCLFTSELGMFGMGAIYYSVTICEQKTKDCARST